MDRSRTALQQLEWSRQDYGARIQPYECTAVLDNRVIGQIHHVPAGWSARICCIPYSEPGAHEVFETYEQAQD